MRPKHALLVMPLLIGMFFAAFSEHGDPAMGKVGRKIILDTAKDPLAVLAERSPGTRGTGVLHPTKLKPVPRQRVFSMVREHEPSPSLPAVMESPIIDSAPQTFGTIPAAIPGNDILPGGHGDTTTPAPLFFPVTQPPVLWLSGGGEVPEPGTWALFIV